MLLGTLHVDCSGREMSFISTYNGNKDSLLWYEINVNESINLQFIFFQNLEIKHISSR